MVKSKIRKCYRICKNQYLVFGDEIENFAKQNSEKGGESSDGNIKSS
jgi:hypothetical protein